MSRTLRNVLIRDLTAEDNQTIREVMRETGCYQASKALLRTAYAYLRLVALSRQQAARIKALEAENRTLRLSTAKIAEALRSMEGVLSGGI